MLTYISDLFSLQNLLSKHLVSRYSILLIVSSDYITSDLRVNEPWEQQVELLLLLLIYHLQSSLKPHQWSCFSIETFSDQESPCPGEQSVILVHLFSSHSSGLGNSMISKMNVKASLVVESYVQHSQEKTHIIVTYEFGTYLYLVSYIRDSLVRLQLILYLSDMLR